MNIIVICSDTFRRDHLGFLNKQAVHTPNLDALARESAVFADFWLCSFPTLVNRIEVFTGRYTFPLFKWGPLPYQFPVMSEIFKRHGHTTGLITDNPHLTRKELRFGRGFDFVKKVPGQIHDRFAPAGAPMIDLPCPAEKLGPPPDRLAQYRRNACWYRQQGTTPTPTVFRSAIEWLDTVRNDFFLWIDAFDPHEPWDPAAEFLKLYPWDESAAKVIWPKEGPADQYSAGELHNIRNLYKAEVSQVDHWIGNLLGHLRSKGLWDNTAIIFFSDHGTYLGEHGLISKPVRLAKRTAIYEDLGHLPMLLRHPAGWGAGQTITGLGQPPDLFPTVLELAGIAPVPWTQAHSLVPRLRGAPSPQSFAVGGYHPHKGRVSCLTVWTTEWSFLYSPSAGLAGSELYHRPTDPTETNNVIAANPAVAADLFAKLEQWLADLGVTTARRRQLLHGRPFTPWNKLQYQFWLAKNRLAHWQNYRGYSQSP